MPPHEEKFGRTYENIPCAEESNTIMNDQSDPQDLEMGSLLGKSNSGPQKRIRDNSSVKINENTSEKEDQNKLILFGVDLSDCSSSKQFVICVTGVFFFTIIYGYLQELITVEIAGRNYGVFLASTQFAGYAFWSLFLDSLRPDKRESMRKLGFIHFLKASFTNALPFRLCVGLSFLKAFDLGLTYIALQYINYPAKTLIKSSRVVFTMFLGIVISGKKYKRREYINVFLLVTGLVIFLHADAKSSAVFHPLGVVMLCTALLSDGLLNNYSEFAMNKYEVGHDAFQLYISSVACVALAVTSFVRGEFLEGVKFFSTPGTFEEIANGHIPTWSVNEKVLTVILFSSFGLFGASCAGAITKTHGAFYMSLTTTSRKALSLMVSFILFPNTCTFQHSVGIAIFMFALIMKSLKPKAISRVISVGEDVSMQA